MLCIAQEIWPDRGTDDHGQLQEEDQGHHHHHQQQQKQQERQQQQQQQQHTRQSFPQQKQVPNYTECSFKRSFLIKH